MGYRIWSKDKNIWELTFDTIYKTRDLAEEQIAELNAVYKSRVSLGELEFYIYPEEVKIGKNGQIVESAWRKGKSDYNGAVVNWDVKSLKLPRQYRK
jgi:hypothetical protein